MILSSRAAVVDFEAMVRYVDEGRFLAATDVWPEEPAPADHPARAVENMVLQAHRAGGIPQAFDDIGEMVLDDLALMEQGLPPVRNQMAVRELVTRYRSKPVESKSIDDLAGDPGPGGDRDPDATPLRGGRRPPEPAPAGRARSSGLCVVAGSAA